MALKYNYIKWSVANERRLLAWPVYRHWRQLICQLFLHFNRRKRLMLKLKRYPYPRLHCIIADVNGPAFNVNLCKLLIFQNYTDIYKKTDFIEILYITHRLLLVSKILFHGLWMKHSCYNRPIESVPNKVWNFVLRPVYTRSTRFCEYHDWCPSCLYVSKN